MSRENIDLALRYTTAINARQTPHELLAPEFTIENATTAVTDRTYYGPEGVQEWISDFFDVLGDDAQYVADPIAAGEDYVVGKVNIVGRGAEARAGRGR